MTASGQNLKISAPGFSEPLVLMGQAVVGNLVGYRVKSIKGSGNSITAVSFYGPEGEVIEGTVLP